MDWAPEAQGRHDNRGLKSEDPVFLCRTNVDATPEYGAGM